jgi:hypothetical protein
LPFVVSSCVRRSGTSVPTRRTALVTTCAPIGAAGAA